MRMIRYCLSLLLLTSVLAGSAYAQRNFPAGVKPADLRDITYPNVRIDDKTYRFAPGARIYNTNNLMLVVNSAPKTGKVIFQLDTQGNVLKLWILTPEEAARLSQ
jgi:hypothetical protein